MLTSAIRVKYPPLPLPALPEPFILICLSVFLLYSGHSNCWFGFGFVWFAFTACGWGEVPSCSPFLNPPRAQAPVGFPFAQQDVHQVCLRDLFEIPSFLSVLILLEQVSHHPGSGTTYWWFSLSFYLVHSFSGFFCLFLSCFFKIESEK